MRGADLWQTGGVKHMLLALSAFIAAAALAVASWLPLWVLVAVVVLISALVALGWPQLMGVSARTSLSTVILVAGVVAVVGAAVVNRVESLFFWSSVALAFGIMVVFVIQVLRGASRPHRLESTLGACSGVVVTTMAAGWVAALRYPTGMASTSDSPSLTMLRVREIPWLEDSFLRASESDGAITVVGLSALTLMVGVEVACLPFRDVVMLPATVLATAGAAVGLSVAWGELTVLFGLLVGGAAGILLAVFRRFVRVQGIPTGVLSQVAVGAAPVAAMGGFVYFTERILLT